MMPLTNQHGRLEREREREAMTLEQICVCLQLHTLRCLQWKKHRSHYSKVWEQMGIMSLMCSVSYCLVHAASEKQPHEQIALANNQSQRIPSYWQTRWFKVIAVVSEGGKNSKVQTAVTAQETCQSLLSGLRLSCSRWSTRQSLNEKLTIKTEGVIGRRTLKAGDANLYNKCC